MTGGISWPWAVFLSVTAVSGFALVGWTTTSNERMMGHVADALASNPCALFLFPQIMNGTIDGVGQYIDCVNRTKDATP